MPPGTARASPKPAVSLSAATSRNGGARSGTAKGDDVRSPTARVGGANDRFQSCKRSWAIPTAVSIKASTTNSHAIARVCFINGNPVSALLCLGRFIGKAPGPNCNPTGELVARSDSLCLNYLKICVEKLPESDRMATSRGAYLKKVAIAAQVHVSLLSLLRTFFCSVSNACEALPSQASARASCPCGLGEQQVYKPCLVPHLCLSG